MNHEAAKRTGKPLWLVFNQFGQYPGVTTEQVRILLADAGATGKFFGRDDDYRVVLDLPPAGVDSSARIQSIVTQLEGIGRLIDPNGPTYK